MDDLHELRRFIAEDASLTRIRETARRELSVQPDPGHDLAHCERVALWTVRLGGDSVNRREAVAAALLHDVINVPKDSPHRSTASEQCAAFASDLLRELDFEPTARERVCEAIRDHSFSRGAVPQSPLGKALQDADRLEALGVLGVFRCISCGTRMGAAFFDGDDPWAQTRELDDLRYSVDHFFTKLLRLPATLHTAAGQREATKRAATIRSLLGALGDELGHPYPAGNEQEK